MEAAQLSDVSDAQTAKQAARQTQTALQTLVSNLGHDESDVVLWDAETAEQQIGIAAPTVVCTALYGWTRALTGGESAVSFALGQNGGTPEVGGLAGGNDAVIAEPHDFNVLCFYDH